VVDTGFGPVTAPAFAWAKQPGRLPVELAEAGIEAGEVDTVIVTHVHDDHLGWTVFDGGRTLHFPNARYVIHRNDWEWMAQSDDPEDVEIFAELIKPIADLGALQLIEDRLEVSGELTVVPAPGHTPGHQVVLIESSGQRAIVAGDTANHPVQVTLPGVASGTDTDPELAVRTRTDLLGRAESEDRLFVTGHFPEPFGRIVTEDGIRSFHSG
jgi:glyoxylase-like metal-dependent hydrolase (beta-lactamase superfamily II)